MPNGRAQWESAHRSAGPWSLVFHGFHSAIHPRVPGSLAADTLRKLLTQIQETHTILGPDDFLSALENDELDSRQVLLSFDDALLSQIDVALPVLQELGIKALFNVYSAIWDEELPMLEIWARFRTVAFESFDEFFSAFCDQLSSIQKRRQETLLKDFPTDYLSEFPFYSENERKFRYLRDWVAGQSVYRRAMTQMLDANGYSAIDLARGIWMSKENVKSLAVEGHAIGLHSHSHPTRMAAIAETFQRAEYERNYTEIVRVTGARPSYVAHPCGSYSPKTLEILTDLGIACGFRNSPSGGNGSRLERPREDHSIVASRMELT